MSVPTCMQVSKSLPTFVFHAKSLFYRSKILRPEPIGGQVLSSFSMNPNFLSLCTKYLSFFLIIIGSLKHCSFGGQTLIASIFFNSFESTQTHPNYKPLRSTSLAHRMLCKLSCLFNGKQGFLLKKKIFKEIQIRGAIHKKCSILKNSM